MKLINCKVELDFVIKGVDLGGCVFIWPNNGMILSNTLHNNFINCFYKCFQAYAHFPMFRKLLRSKLYIDISKYINYSLWKLDIS